MKRPHRGRAVVTAEELEIEQWALLYTLTGYGSRQERVVNPDLEPLRAVNVLDMILWTVICSEFRTSLRSHDYA